MRQNHVLKLKAQYPEHLFLLQLGDRYFAKGEDAVKVEQAAGDRKLGYYKQSVYFAQYALRDIVERLVRKGNKVAIVTPL
jgi:DNA mismatch repair ATPase MutS